MRRATGPVDNLPVSAATCPRCGAALRAESAWCPLCFTAVQPTSTPAAASALSGPSAPFVPGAASTPRLDHAVQSGSRWRKGPTTFGPVGRVVATVLLFVPYLFFAVDLAVGMVGIAGLALWTCVVLPKGLRDVWARDRRVHLPPT